MRTRWIETLILTAAALAPAAVSAGGTPAPVVPEPTGLALFAVGTAAVVVGLRLRKSR